MDKDFEVLEHTADIGIIAHGKDMEEAFANAAKGMFSLITDLKDVQEVETRDVEITASDSESLLVAWLNELIYFFDVENLLFKKFVVSDLNINHLKARAWGEKVNTSRHNIKLGIKATTYHMLKMEKYDGVKVQVIFDI